MTKNRKRKKHIAKKYIHGKLLRRIQIFFIIILILAIICIYKMFTGDLSLYLAFIAMSLGLVIGYIVGRVGKILWKEDQEKIMSHMDSIVVIALMVYIGIEISKNWIFGHWLSGNDLHVFGLIFILGTLLGRTLGMIKTIKKVLKQELGIKL